MWLGSKKGGNSRDPLYYTAPFLYFSPLIVDADEKSHKLKICHTHYCAPFMQQCRPFCINLLYHDTHSITASFFWFRQGLNQWALKPGAGWKADAVNMPSICVKAASEWSSGSILSSYSHSWTSVGDRLTTNLKTYVKPRSNRLQFSLHQNRILVVNNVCSRQGCKRPLKV